MRNWLQVSRTTVGPMREPTVEPRSKRIEVLDESVASALRAIGPAGRLEMAFRAERFARSLMEGGIRARHPDWNDVRVREEIARLWLHGPA